MADLPVQPIQNYGSLLSSYGEGLANQENATTANLTAQANASQVPSEIAARNAGTQLVQTQTTGADLANQQKALQMGYYQHLLQNMSAPAANDQSPTQTQATQDATADPNATSTNTRGKHTFLNSDGMPAGDDDMSLADIGIDPGHIASGAQQQFSVKNVWTPQEYQQLQLALASGVPGASESVQKMHEARIQNAVANAQFAASRAYDSANVIATAPDGLAFDVLQQISPNKDVPAAIAKFAKDKNWSPEELDEFTRMYATEVGSASHRYSGRDVEVGKDGVARDKQTQQPLLGAVPEGLDAKSFADAYRESTKLVDVPNSDGSTSKLPQWKAAGATSATQYIVAQENGRTLPFASANTPRPVLGPNAAPVQGAAPGQPPQQQGGAQQQPQGDPVLRQALSDPTYKLPSQPVVAGRTPTPAQLDQQKATVQARTDLLKDSQDATTAAASSLQYLQAAKSIMDSKGATVGAYGGLINTLSRYTGFNGSTDAANYAEIAKNLGNAALANAKGIYGQRMTQSEVGLQLNELSPSVHMPDKAISNLIDTNISASKYAIDSANRVQKYLSANGDPQQFATWNQKYFPKAETVNSQGQTKTTQASSTTSGGLPRITSAQQLSTLQKGTRFMGPDGQIRVKN